MLLFSVLNTWYFQTSLTLTFSPRSYMMERLFQSWLWMLLLLSSICICFMLMIWVGGVITCSALFEWRLNFYTSLGSHRTKRRHQGHVPVCWVHAVYISRNKLPTIEVQFYDFVSFKMGRVLNEVHPFIVSYVQRFGDSGICPDLYRNDNQNGSIWKGWLRHLML